MKKTILPLTAIAILMMTFGIAPVCSISSAQAAATTSTTTASAASTGDLGGIILQLVGYLAPLGVMFITSILKKWISTQWAPLIVLLLGGISTLIGVGPSPGGNFIDATVNVSYISGTATLIYDVFKKLFNKKTG